MDSCIGPVLFIYMFSVSFAIRIPLDYVGSFGWKSMKLMELESDSTLLHATSKFSFWIHAKLGVLASWLPKKSVQKMRGMCECEENLSRFIKCQMYSNVKSLSFFCFYERWNEGDVGSVSKILKSPQVNLMLEGLWLGFLLQSSQRVEAFIPSWGGYRCVAMHIWPSLLVTSCLLQYILTYFSSVTSKLRNIPIWGTCVLEIRQEPHALAAVTCAWTKERHALKQFLGLDRWIGEDQRTIRQRELTRFKYHSIWMIIIINIFWWISCQYFQNQKLTIYKIEWIMICHIYYANDTQHI